VKRKYIQLQVSEILTLEAGYKYGPQYQFRHRCHCLLLSHQGKRVSELAAIFQVSKLTIYNWFRAWESAGIVGLRNQAGQGGQAKLSVQNPQHITQVKALLEQERQSAKTVVASLHAQLDIQMHPATLRRFLKSLVTDSAVSARASKASRTKRNANSKNKS
jgi:transposase